MQCQGGLVILHQALMEGQKFQVNIDFLVQDLKVLAETLLQARVGTMAQLSFLLPSFREQLRIFQPFIRSEKAALELFSKESLMMEPLLLSNVQERYERFKS